MALVTGAASGIGKVIAERLANEGAHVIVTDLDAEGAQDVAAGINRSAGPERAAAFPMNVADPSQVVDVFQSLRRTYGGLDILVSNAGIAPVGAIDDLSLADWQRSLDINTTGHFLVSAEAVKLMKEQGLGGSLVFIGTKNVPAPGAEFGAYSVAKAAEVQLARVLALENGQHGIRANVVNPDAIFQGSQLWSQELREERAAAHGVTVEGLEDFYRQRNLLKAPGVRGRCGGDGAVPGLQPLGQDHGGHDSGGRRRKGSVSEVGYQCPSRRGSLRGCPLPKNNPFPRRRAPLVGAPTIFRTLLALPLHVLVHAHCSGEGKGKRCPGCPPTGRGRSGSPIGPGCGRPCPGC